jgi:hypothetical protein
VLAGIASCFDVLSLRVAGVSVSVHEAAVFHSEQAASQHELADLQVPASALWAPQLAFLTVSHGRILLKSRLAAAGFAADLFAF